MTGHGADPESRHWQGHFFLTMQLPCIEVVSLRRPESCASWHMDVPPALEMCSSSMAGREAREQLSAPANAKSMDGATCRGIREG